MWRIQKWGLCGKDRDKSIGREKIENKGRTGDRGRKKRKRGVEEGRVKEGEGDQSMESRKDGSKERHKAKSKEIRK